MSIHLLAESDDTAPVSDPVVYLRSFNGSGMRLLPADRAEALLRHVTALPALEVTGGLATGYAWPVLGALPRHTYVVSPLAAPAWPAPGRPVCVVIELWWQADPVSGRRRILTCCGLFNDPFTAYLTACCLWARPSVGRGAMTVVLYGPDRVPYVVDHAASACAQLSASQVDELLATCCERFTTEAPPAPGSHYLSSGGAPGRRAA